MTSDDKKKKHAEYMRKYYWENRDRLLELMKIARNDPVRGARIKEVRNRSAIKNREKTNEKWRLEYAANPEKFKNRQKVLRAKKPELIKLYEKNKYKNNKEKIIARTKKYYAKVKDNPEYKKARYESCRKWMDKNPSKLNKYTNDRRARKINACPRWAHQVAIECFYEFAKLKSDLTGRKYEVDHIVPLSSKLVCGLHTHTNLQVIERFQNRSKSNRSWPDMP